MPEFQYQGVDKAGKKVSGKLEANGEGDVRMLLRSQGVRPTRISKGGALNTDIGMLLSGGVHTLKLEQLVTFTRQLQVLISSGVPIVQGLEILGEQAPDKSLKMIILSLREKVSGGMFFWEAIASFPKAFPKIFVALVRAGEASGSLDQMLKRLSRYLEDADRLRKLLKGAMMYPIIVTSIGIGVVALMMIFVIPKFEEMLKGSGQELPGPTQFVIDVSHFMAGNALYILISTVAFVYLTMRFAKSPSGKAIIDRTLFKAPFFGNIVQKAGVARFSRTMQTLLTSGVNLIDAIDICKATINNVVLEEAVATIRAEVESGKTLGSVVGRLNVFPKMAVQMMSVGESTGNLDKMLEKVADFFEEEVEALVSGMTKLIEPFILVFLGGTVGGLMIAMYLPIFKLAGSAG
ncbi:MAG: type II secretion system F family protein [Bdellovibrionota bacterium]